MDASSSSSSSLSQSSSSNQAKDSSQESKIPPLSTMANTTTVSGDPESPPLGSLLSLGTANATATVSSSGVPLATANISDAPESPPLGSLLSMRTANETATVSGSGLLSAQLNTTVCATSSSLRSDFQLPPSSKSQKMEAGSSASSSSRRLQQVDASSSSSIQVKDSSQDLPLLGSGPSLGSDISVALPTSNKKDPKQKAFNFPILRITIGDWSKVSVYRNEMVGKVYFGKQKLVWEMDKLGKIEIPWDSVLSHKACLQTSVMSFELSKKPKFYKEGNPFAGEFQKYIEVSEFGPNHSSSNFRRHEIQLEVNDFQKNLEKLLHGWPTLGNVQFPTLDSLLF